MDKGNILERVLWTAVQAFFGALPVTVILTGPEIRAMVLSGVAASLAALISLAKNVSMEQLKQSE